MGEKNESEELVEFEGRRIYPEVAEYFRTYQQVAWDYEDAIAKADYEYSLADRQARRVAQGEGRQFDRYGADAGVYGRNHEAWTDAKRAAEAARRTASPDLLLDSPHKEVAWIAKEALFDNQGDEIEEHARTILKHLPATSEELWTVAKDNHSMCSTFDQFFERAEAAGILNDGNTVAVREMAALRSYIRRNYGSSYLSPFMTRLSPVLKAYRQDYDRRLAEAKAEWQGLDEAYAENAHRNRSEGARRAAETRRRNQSIISTQSAMTGEIITAEYDEKGPVRATGTA